jgi:hypothetical protein
MTERIAKDDLIFLGAAIVLSQRHLAIGISNPGEVASVVDAAQALYDEISKRSQRVEHANPEPAKAVG